MPPFAERLISFCQTDIHIDSVKRNENDESNKKAIHSLKIYVSFLKKINSKILALCRSHTQTALSNAGQKSIRNSLMGCSCWFMYDFKPILILQSASIIVTLIDLLSIILSHFISLSMFFVIFPFMGVHSGIGTDEYSLQFIVRMFRFLMRFDCLTKKRLTHNLRLFPSTHWKEPGLNLNFSLYYLERMDEKRRRKQKNSTILFLWYYFISSNKYLAAFES